MNNLKLKKIIQILVEAESGAAKQAKSQGLTYAQFGRWTDPKTGRVVAKSHGDQLIKITPGKDDPEAKKGRERDTFNQMKQYQAVGKQGTPPKAVHPADIPPDYTAQKALDQRKMQQKIQQDPDVQQPGDIAKINPEWHNNLMVDLEDSYGFQPDQISPKVVGILYKNKLNAEDAAATYSKIKNDVKDFKKKECRRLSSENIIREQPGEHDHKSIEQLEREIGEIEIKKSHNRGLGNFSDWSGRKFALRKKQGGSTGIRPDPKERTLAPGFKVSKFGETP